MRDIHLLRMAGPGAALALLAAPPQVGGGDLCGAPCSGCCIVAKATPSCDNAPCCQLICAQLPLCCLVAWSDTCAEVASSVCQIDTCDCNDNGIPDSLDIASGTSADANGNGMPDECEDCNGNGVSDCVDLSGGASDDCNGNGVPDECEPDVDCNANGIADLCDLALGQATDCNGNGALDECDIDAGLEEDCNLDIVPDSCEILCGIDLVFVIDTSGSMGAELPAVCSDMVAAVAGGLPPLVPGAVTLTVLGINQSGAPCTTGSVAGQIGTVIPGDPGTCTIGLDQESWGSATAVVAAGFPWSSAALRVVVPVSDEGPCGGFPCEDPGPDRDAVINAASVAIEHGVLVFPVTGEESDGCVMELADRLAGDTGGRAFHRELGDTYAAIGPALVVEVVRHIQFCSDFDGDLVPDDCQVPGDLDNDGTVGIVDFLALLLAWGPCPVPCPPACAADLDGDCAVGITDMLTLLNNWT